MFIELRDVDVEAFNSAAKTMKCLQLASGAIYTDENGETWEAIHDEKSRRWKALLKRRAERRYWWHIISVQTSTALELHFRRVQP